jgi:hypothetical protein
MTPASYNLPDVYQGDSTTTISFEFLLNDVPIDLTGATVLFNFRHKKEDYGFKAGTYNGKVVYTDASLGKFNLLPYRVRGPWGVYDFDVKITYTDGTIYTYIIGTQTVLKDVAP